MGVFLLAIVALGLAAHCRSFFREEPDAVDLPSTQQLKQNFQTKGTDEPKRDLMRILNLKSGIRIRKSLAQIGTLLYQVKVKTKSDF